MPASTRGGHRRVPVAAGLILLVIYVVTTRCLFLTSSTNMWDSVDYIRNVEMFVAQGVTRFGTLEFGHPLYPYLCGFVCLVSRLLGGPESVFWACKVFGVLITASSLLPLFWICRWLFRHSGWGLMAAAVYAAVPLSWWWTSEIMSDAAGVAFMLWTIGFLVRWVAGGSSVSLATSCVLLGASVLIRISIIAQVPLFAGLLLLGAHRRRTWKSLLMLVLVPVPVLASIGYQFLRMQATPSFFEFFFLGQQNELLEVSIMDLEQWAILLRHLDTSLGTIPLVAAGIGLLAALVRRPGVFFFTLLWMLPFLFLQITHPCKLIRHCLPLMPMTVVMLTTLFVMLSRPSHGKDLSAVAAGAVMALMVHQALPNVIALHYRVNTLDAVACWYEKNTPEDALIISKKEFLHVIHFSGRESLRYAPDRYGASWDDTEGPRAPLTCAMVANKLESALEAGRPVFVCDLMEEEWFEPLEAGYHLTEVGRLDSKTERLRNGHDAGFGMMDETWRKPRDITFYRLDWIDHQGHS